MQYQTRGLAQAIRAIKRGLEHDEPTLLASIRNGAEAIILIRSRLPADVPGEQFFQALIIARNFEARDALRRRS